eukprot:Em0002g1476a
MWIVNVVDVKLLKVVVASGHSKDVDALFAFVLSTKSKWKDIDRHQGFTMKDLNDLVTLKTLSQDQDCFQELLHRWLNWAPPSRSFSYTEDLVGALRHVELHRLALNLEKN